MATQFGELVPQIEAPSEMSRGGGGLSRHCQRWAFSSQERACGLGRFPPVGRDELLGLRNASRFPACPAARTGLSQDPSPGTAATPPCLPQRPGRVAPARGNTIERAQGMPSAPRPGNRRGKSQASNTACGFLGGNHRRLSSGWQNPQSAPHEAWPGSTLAAKTYVGTRLHWQHLLVAISSPVQYQPLAGLALLLVAL